MLKEVLLGIMLASNPHVYVSSSINGSEPTIESKMAKAGDDARLFCFEGENLAKDAKWHEVKAEDVNYTNGGQHFWSKMEYEKRPFECGNPCEIKLEAGTKRYACETSKGASPGIDDVDSEGIMDNVHRISAREDDTYLGWMKSFKGIPFIWWSAGEENGKPSQYAKNHQCEKYIGCDCADLVVAGWRRSSGKDVPYFQSAGFYRNGLYVKRGYAEIIAENVKLKDGVFTSNGKALKFGEDVKAGDLIYFGAHIGAISKDEGVQGYLDPEDKIFHTLYDEPTEVEIGPAVFSIVRWKK